jgi:hypothetical protein
VRIYDTGTHTGRPRESWAETDTDTAKQRVKGTEHKGTNIPSQKVSKIMASLGFSVWGLGFQGLEVQKKGLEVQKKGLEVQKTPGSTKTNMTSQKVRKIMPSINT